MRKIILLSVSYLFLFVATSVLQAQATDVILVDGVTVRETQRGAALVFDKPILYSHARTKPAANHTETYKMIKAFLDANADVVLVVEGHTSQIGRATQNRDVGKNRADGIYYALLNIGVPSVRLMKKVYGEVLPEHFTDEQNRRVEVIALKSASGLRKYEDFARRIGVW